MLAQVELVFGMICAADTNEQLQAVQEQIMPRLAAHYDRILMNDRLFERVRALYDRRETLGLDAEQPSAEACASSWAEARCSTRSRRSA